MPSYLVQWSWTKYEKLVIDAASPDEARARVLDEYRGDKANFQIDLVVEQPER